MYCCQLFYTYFNVVPCPYVCSVFFLYSRIMFTHYSVLLSVCYFIFFFLFILFLSFRSFSVFSFLCIFIIIVFLYIFKDTCYAWGKKQQNLQLLGILIQLINHHLTILLRLICPTVHRFNFLHLWTVGQKSFLSDFEKMDY